MIAVGSRPLKVTEGLLFRHLQRDWLKNNPSVTFSFFHVGRPRFGVLVHRFAALAIGRGL